MTFAFARFRGMLCAGSLLLVTLPAFAQSPTPESPPPLPTIEAIDTNLAQERLPKPADPAPKKKEADRIGDLEKKIKDLEKQVKANAPKKTPPGEWEDVSGEKWTVKLGGHVQMDYINWINASDNIVPIGVTPGAQDYFEFRRLRLVADGTGYGVYDFRLQMTLEPETVGESGGQATSPDVKDAYISMNEIPIVGRFRIGNFFVPFGLEQVTNDTMNIFMERSIPTQGIFTADREVGFAFYNCTTDQNISWATGMFFDNISDTLKERIDDNQGYRLSGRLNWVPYYDEPSNGRYAMHTGIGVLHTRDQDHSVRFRARPQIHEGPRVIDSLAIPADSYTTGNVEWAWVNANFTVQSEAYMSSVDRIGNSAVTVGGAYVHCSYFVTGENRVYERFGQHGAQFGRNSPYTNFFLVPGCAGWGALELKARWSNLNLQSLGRGEYNDGTVGFNWYWTDRVRVMCDWIHPVTSPAARPFGAINADILAMRMDFNW